MTTPIYRQSGGWFSEVSGAKVTKVDLTWMSHTYYTAKHPTGVLFHYTVGCTADIQGVYKSNGYVGAPFCVGSNGSIFQYLPVNSAGWHAYQASHVYAGIEHEAWPGHCELNGTQLDRSARLAAAIVHYVKKVNGYSIPVKHLSDSGAALMAPGFIDHRQGPSANPSDWNHDGHTNHLYVWTWDKYISTINGYLSPSGGGVLSDLSEADQLAMRNQLARYDSVRVGALFKRYNIVPALNDSAGNPYTADTFLAAIQEKDADGTPVHENWALGYDEAGT